ncbi:MAG: helix-turn-helix domain-containing protein [Pseudonocardiaceae bacterium]
MVCDPCGRAGPDPLPLEFYLPEPVQAALLEYDFGRFLRRVRAYRQWSQETLGGVLGLTQGRISAIEGGGSLYDIRIIARMHQRLGIPAPLLGFGDPATVVGGGIAGRKGSWMERRDFVQHVATLALAAAGGTALDIDRLVALLYPDTDATGTRRISVADVEALEHATAEYQRWDYTYGGAIARDATIAQLRGGLPLLRAEQEPEVHSRLQTALVHLALLAAWMSFDVGQHDAARRMWTVGLNLSRDTNDPWGVDLTGHLLVDMAEQALHLGRPDEAERLVKVGLAADVGTHPVSPSTATMLASRLSFAHAHRGDAKGCDRARGQVEDAFTAVDPGNAAPWASVDEAAVSTWQGKAYYELGRATGDRRWVDKAVPLLARTLTRSRPTARALYLPDLAGAHALAGDVGTAVTVGRQAVDTATGISSRRTHDRLRVLNTVLEPMHTSPGVAELRERLALAA